MLKLKIRYLILIFSLSLVVRVAFLLISDYPDKSLKNYDTPSWDGVAWNLVLSRGFLEPDNKPTSVRPPIYPLFLAIIYYIFGRNYFVVYIIQSIISSLSNSLLFVFLNLFFNIKTTFITCLICSIWPAFVVYSGLICSETLYIFLFLSFLIIYFKAYFSNKTFLYILAGVILGISNLTRSTVVIYPIFLIFFFLLFKFDTKLIFKTLLMFIVSLAVISPWTIRNYIVFKRFLLINTAAAELFWSGTYIPWDGICKHGRDENFYKLFNLENPIDNERKMLKEGIKNIISNPLGFLILSIKKFYRFWFKPIGYEILVSYGFKIFAILALLLQIVIVIFCWWSIFVNTYKNKIKFFPILVLFVYFTIMHNLLAPIPRYRLPLEIIIIGFSLDGIRKLTLKYEEK